MITPTQDDEPIVLTGSDLSFPPYGYDPNTMVHSLVVDDHYGNYGSISGLGLSAANVDFIKGELVCIERNYTEIEFAMVSSEANFKQKVKDEMALSLAKEILRKNLVEFTKKENFQTGNVTISVRAYLVPDDKIKAARNSK
jgi:hypothetical protein